MDPTHLHLLLNHVPTVGFGIGIALFIASLVARSNDLKQASLVVFVVVALVTIPTYVTGNAAQIHLQDQGAIGTGEGTRVTASLVQTHEGIAFLALVFMEVTGAFAWLALWQFRRTSILGNGMAGGLLVLCLATLAFTALAANVGGHISHPEIRGAEEVTTFAGHMGRVVGNFVRDTPWAWSSSETIHFIGLSLLVGVLLLINMRMLGFMKQIPFEALDRLLPWAMLGFAVNTMTGMLFFAASSNSYVGNPAFYWKLVFVVLGGVNVLYFTFDRTWAQEPGRDAPGLSKFAAVCAMFLWVGVMYWGSMLPFIGQAF
ncbi:MAG TPA: hypothetical protein VKB50_16195 [Vicinamibacterales bacterium]|nr:hypothetical protein [Vicinamibacterales bacterium]